jgi:hypothetical protein
VGVTPDPVWYVSREEFTEMYARALIEQEDTGRMSPETKEFMTQISEGRLKVAEVPEAPNE